MDFQPQDMKLYVYNYHYYSKDGNTGHKEDQDLVGQVRFRVEEKQQG